MYHLNQYSKHKIYIVSVLLVSIGTLWVYTGFHTDTFWPLLISGAYIVGYTHYFVGGFYQLQGIRKNKSRRLWYWFIGIAIASSVFSYLCVVYSLMGVFAFAVIAYFMVHGYLNENTIYTRQSGRAPVPLYTLALTTVLFGMLMYGVGHQSWYFSSSLEFYARSSFALRMLVEQSLVVQLAKNIGFLSLIVAVLASGIAVYKQKTPFALVLASAVMIASVLTYLAQPVYYVLVLVLVNGYHFVMWFFFYLENFIARNRLQEYLFAHGIVLAPFLLLFLHNDISTQVQSIFLNSNTFLAVTFVHISTSFLNETFVKDFLKL